MILQSDTSLAARCFGFSSGQCAPIPAPSDITFSVDLSDVIPSGSVYLIGDFTSPPYQAGAIAMTSIGAGIYQTTVNDICAGTINFKFVNGSPNNGANEENFSYIILINLKMYQVFR